MYAFLADVHLGTKLSKSDYLKSLDKFLGIIKNHEEECHCIFVLGDLFDKRLSIDDYKFASIFLVNLVYNRCGRNGNTNVPVHFIHGTFTHDYDQYDIFMKILEKIDNVEVFYTKEACARQLSNGAKVLYLPQKYGDTDYDKFLSEKYDIIIGHGVVNSDGLVVCPRGNKEIEFPADKLGAISNICVFGHFHDYTDFGNNVFYAGSMLRWKYGEDVQKVFFICDDNFKPHTIPNEFALDYKTIRVNSPDELRTIISNGIDTPHRFMINSSKEDLESYYAIMRINKNNPNIRCMISSNKEDRSDNVKMDINSITSAPISEPIPELISYISEKYGTDESEQIREYESKINRE
ncbi:MAG: hypothetical protein IKA36_05805 [Clostridia bacterium]|nr:hypothetical protein [Clostridia bacterium]